MRRLRCLTLLASVVTFLALGSPSHAQYQLGGANAALTPNSFEWSWDGTQLAPYRAALEDPAYFGPAGVVPVQIVTSTLAAIDAGTLAGLNGFIAPWPSDSDYSPAQVTAIVNFFLAGGDLILLEDDSGHDVIGQALGIPTSGSNGSVSNGGAPMFNGPFGLAVNVTQNGNVGQFAAADIASHGGSVGGTNAAGQITAAFWAPGAYAPGAGALIMMGDVDMWSAFGGAVYGPGLAGMDDNGRFALNSTAFVVTASPLAVPEPGSLALLFGFASAGLVLVRKRR
jgi:hypothetical protein